MVGAQNRAPDLPDFATAGAALHQTGDVPRALSQFAELSGCCETQDGKERCRMCTHGALNVACVRFRISSGCRTWVAFVAGKATGRLDTVIDVCGRARGSGHAQVYQRRD